MKNSLYIFLGCLLLFKCQSQIENEKICFIRGKVVNRDSEIIILIKAFEDSRYRGIEIPIKEDGTFEYRIMNSFVEEYELIFKDEREKGAWRPIAFYNDGDTIDFKLYSMSEGDNNKVAGSELVLKAPIFRQEMTELFYNEINYWEDQLYAIDTVERDKEEYSKLISNKIDSINGELVQWKIEFIKKDLSLFSYARLLDLIKQTQYKEVSSDLLENSFDILKQKFPNHPYNSICQNLINGLSNVKIGGFYVDFKAPDRSGMPITLSEMVANNKLTLIDLWAPWCGPCIKKSKSIVPLYEDLKVRGFDVVAVVGGISTKEEFDKAVQKYNYPWATLIEVNDQNKIWEKYNILNSGGSQFLVDSAGMIRAINPKPEEIAELLSQL